MITVKLQDIKSIHRNHLHSYTLTIIKQKEKSRKQVPDVNAQPTSAHMVDMVLKESVQS